MNFRSLESSQKLRGGFYTDPVIASFLTKWIKEENPESLLEPSCGDGIFFESIEENQISSLKNIVACEIDSIEATKAKTRTNLLIKIINCDFLKWFLFEAQNQYRFDAIIGNPPFIRYQYLPEEQQFLAGKIFSQLDLPFTRHTNAWVPFVLASIKLLNPGGRLAMVIPSEIFHIPYAGSLRNYLIAQCSKILIIDPKEIWFHNTLQGTVLILAEKKREPSEKSKGVSVVSIPDKEALKTNPEYIFQKAHFINNSLLNNKWMSLFLDSNELALLSQLIDSPKVKHFSNVASVDVGIVTGANNFFLVPNKIIDDFNLGQWAHPMFGRSNHVKGLLFTKEDYASNCINGLPSNFLWFQEEKIEDLPENVRQYLLIGLNQKIPNRYKCRIRKPWYRVPSVYSSPIAMLKRAHDYPRLVLNSANAFCTDTAYRINPLGIASSTLVATFVNSLTCLTAELEGRHYGGGVLELVPSEIERLLIPIINDDLVDIELLDKQYRDSKNHLDFLYNQDSIVLSEVGLSRNDQLTLFNAWLKLRDHRQRIPYSETNINEK